MLEKIVRNITAVGIVGTFVVGFWTLTIDNSNVTQIIWGLWFILFCVISFLIIREYKRKGFYKTRNISHSEIQSAPKLNPNLGEKEPTCPYCDKPLDKFPTRKVKCPNCGADIYKRTRPFDGVPILIREDQLELIEIDSAIKNGYYESYISQKKEFEESRSELKNIRNVDSVSDSDTEWHLLQKKYLSAVKSCDLQECEIIFGKMAFLRFKEKGYKDAIGLWLQEFFLKVCGASDKGFTWVSEKEIIEFESFGKNKRERRKEGLLRLFIESMKYENLTINDIKETFMNLKEPIVGLKYPCSKEFTWPYVLDAIDEWNKILKK